MWKTVWASHNDLLEDQEREDIKLNRGILALVLVVAVVIGVVAIGRSGDSDGSKPKPDPDKTKPVEPKVNSGGTKIERPEIVEAAKVTVECESFTSWENKETKKGEVVLVKRNEKIGQYDLGYLEIPDGWIDKCGYKDNKGKAFQLPGRAKYSFEVPRDDIYHIFLRAKWLDNCGNSIYLRIDGGSDLIIDDTEGKVSESSYLWAWHPLRRKGGQLRQIQLQAGKHTLELGTREDGPKLDKFLITTEATKPARDEVNP